MKTTADTRRERLQELVDKHGTASALNIALGRQPRDSSFSQILNGNANSKGGKPKTMGHQMARAIELGLGLPEGWMDNPRPDTQTIQGFTPLYESTATVTIPRYDTGGSMGRGLVLRDQPGVIESFSVSREWVEKNVRGYSSVENLCVVTGFGDSMRGMFNSGDPLIVDTGVREVAFDAVYFFRVEDEGFIKRLQRVPGTGLLAISENSAYRDWVIDKSMDFEVFGRVMKAWHSEDF